MPIQQRDHIVRVPRRLAEFDGMSPRARQRFEKFLESFEVHRPSRRQLIQDGTERRAEALRAREEQPERLLRLLQLLHVREKTARLHGIHEPARRSPGPCGERRRRGKAIKGVVHLDRIEMLSVILEPAALRELRGIKIALPMPVLPARAADTYGGDVKLLMGWHLQ